MDFFTQPAAYLYILLALVILLLVVTPALKRMLRDKAEVAGRRMGMSLEEKIHHKDLTQLNRTLEFSDADTGIIVVSSVLDANKKITKAGEHDWYAKEVRDDDIQISWHEDGGTGQLKIVRARAFGKTAMGGSQWKKLRQKIETAAQEQGVAVREGANNLKHTGEEVDGDQIWMAEA